MEQLKQHWNSPEAIRELIIRLVSVPSISGTDGETRMAETIVEILQEIPYFQSHPEHVMSIPVPGDPLSRFSVAALYKASVPTTKTIVLLSHFDVVGVEDFGLMKRYAFKPEMYTDMLRTVYYETLGQEAKYDLDSGDWLFGRGVMDMKAGLAIQLAVLSEIAQKQDFDGNILLLATPDEEISSEGMFAAVPYLNQLRKQYGLEYSVCICSEPNFSSYPGDRAKHICTGSVGKLLPLIFCVGKETHAGEPIEGVNAGWMAAEIVNRMELSDAFVDRLKEEKSPPPTCLKVSDLKSQYDVQTPSQAYVLYNILTLSQKPGEVLQKIKSIAEDAAGAIYERVANKHLMYAGVESPKVSRPAVYEYSELYEKGVRQFGKHFEESIATVMDEGIKRNLDSQNLSVKIAEETSKFFMEEGPFYLILFAPPYYPHVYLDRTSEEEKHLLSIVDEVVKDAEEQYGEKIEVKNFLTGLSDVSYCRVRDAVEVVPTLRNNLPLWGKQYNIPIDDIIELNLPTINIGPYGKDAHKRTERLELGYSTKVAPQLLKKAMYYVLSKE